MARLPSAGRTVAIIVALALAGAAAFFIWRYVDDIEDQVREDQELIEVYVATGPIPEGMFADTAISSGLIVLDELPRGNRPVGAITGLEQISGLVAGDQVLPGEVIIQARFVEAGSAALEFQVPEGLQAISVEVNIPEGVAGFIRAGDNISVIAHIEVPEAAAPVIGPDGTLVQPDAAADGPSETRSQFVVQNIEVLSVGRRVVLTDEQGQPVDAVQQTESVLATLAVTDQQAEQLVFALQEGSLYFTLLSEDYEPQTTPGRTFDNLFVPEA